MENSKRESIPMQEKLRLSKSQGATTPAELKRMQNVPYASAVGSFMYAVRCTCPDVAFTQNITSRFQQNLGDLHWTTVKNILKYFRNTKDTFLVYGDDIKQELRVSCYTDAGYLTDADDLKSQTEYVFVLNGGAEAIWVRKFISRLSVVPTIEEPITMYCDNTGAITIANEFGITKGARHFHAKVHYIREVNKARGYGREFHERLVKHGGTVDVNDCCRLVVIVKDSASPGALLVVIQHWRHLLLRKLSRLELPCSV
ncbi:hypothetical protein Tco_0888696, partial [Tanacetum coccineum]